MKDENMKDTAAFEQGCFSNLFEQFIKYKQSLGFKYGYHTQKVLVQLNRELNRMETGKTVLTRNAVESLASHHNDEAPATQAKRAALLRHFAEFMVDMGYEAYIYPIHCSRITYDSFDPYIFTHEQMAAIIQASDSLRPTSESPRYHFVWPAFMRVLYCCGLRLSEAVNLRVADVDLDNGILYIGKSKNGTSRYVPVSNSLQKYLQKYAMDAALTENEDTYFFPAPDGGHYHKNTAYERIKSFYQSAGIPKLGNGRFPRIHDVRHTYSCHALEMMQQKEYDLYYSLPILSAYLGHQGIRDTERYLHLPQVLYGELSDVSALMGIIPEVDADD